MNRLFTTTTTCLLRTPSFKVAQRSLASAATKDSIRELYLNELRVASSTVGKIQAEKADIKDKFAAPPAPEKPAVEKAPQLQALTEADLKLEESSYPPYVDPIDAKEEYDDAWEFDTSVDNGFKRKYPMDYEHAHH